MSDISSEQVKNSFKQLLQCGTPNGGISASYQVVQDADGTSSALGLSTTNVYINTYAVTATNTATISRTNTGDQTITLTGDVTGTGTGSFAATIGVNKVTYAKMQQISATKLLGSTTGSTADIGEITVGSGLSLAAGTLTSSFAGTVTLGTQIFTSGSGTYTPTAGTDFVRVRMTAGGGGGGGVSNAGAYGVGCGGNSGSYLEFFMTAAQIGASKSYGVGAGGAGGNSGATGTTGSVTTFADWTATGGLGGTGQAGAAAPKLSADNAGSNAANTIGTGTVIVNKLGNTATRGFAISTPLAEQSWGGFSLIQPWAPTGATTICPFEKMVAAGNSANSTASGPGQGGHGAVSLNSAVNTLAWTGGTGLIIVEEYIIT